jgi:hypothetical protein
MTGVSVKDLFRQPQLANALADDAGDGRSHSRQLSGCSGRDELYPQR